MLFIGTKLGDRVAAKIPYSRLFWNKLCKRLWFSKSFNSRAGGIGIRFAIIQHVETRGYSKDRKAQ
jgi:hypothetical protein